MQDPALGLIYVRLKTRLPASLISLLTNSRPQCLIGSKVDALSSALTWIHDHAHLSLPTVSPSILLLSPNRTDDLTASLTDPESSISAPSIANKMIDAYLRSLEQQRMGFFVAIGIWALVFLMGLIGAWWRAIGQNRWRHWRGATARNGSGGGRQAPMTDGTEKAHFASLHLGSFADLLDPNGSGEKSLGAGSPVATSIDAAALAAGVDQGNSVSPSSRSWASLVDFFKATEPAARSSEAVESAASPPPPPETRLRPLALPTLPTLRTRGAKDRLRPVISHPRPLLRPFRVLRDSHLAQQQRQRWERWRSKEESDLVLLRDESRSKLGRTGALRSAFGSHRTASSDSHLHQESAEDHRTDGLGAVDDLSPEADLSDSPNLPDHGLWPPRPCAALPSQSRHLSFYTPSSRPLAATNNPFASPFDE